MEKPYIKCNLVDENYIKPEKCWGINVEKCKKREILVIFSIKLLQK